MSHDEVRAACLAFAGATEDFPFGPDVAVFRVGGKMFALLGERAPEGFGINLKCDPQLAVMHRATYAGVVPGWHMNKRHWNTVYLRSDVPPTVVVQMIEDSYELVRGSLPARLRTLLGA